MKKHLNNLALILLILVINIPSRNAFCLISPVKRDQKNKPCLTNCNDIRLVSQKIDLYHHPLGIWLVTCNNKFQNLYPQKILQEMAFNSGFDVNRFEDKLYCDEFDNFRVIVDGVEKKNIRIKEQCPNYVDRIGIKWTNDDHTGTGFLNTWKVEFKPEETKHIKVSFSFVVTKPGIDILPQLNEPWYKEFMTWLKHEYSKRAENEFVLPLNMGSFWAMALDSLIIRTHNSSEWLTIEDKSKIVYEPQNMIVYTFSEPVDFFSPPELDLQNLTEDNLKDKMTAELILLRNSFFAKYGRKFDVDWLKLYFQQQPWYYENPHYDNWYLTDFDIQNIKFIYHYEQERKSHD